jgi:hypothetical protein
MDLLTSATILVGLAIVTAGALVITALILAYKKDKPSDPQ